MLDWLFKQEKEVKEIPLKKGYSTNPPPPTTPVFPKPTSRPSQGER